MSEPTRILHVSPGICTYTFPSVPLRTLKHEPNLLFPKTQPQKPAGQKKFFFLNLRQPVAKKYGQSLQNVQCKPCSSHLEMKTRHNSTQIKISYRVWSQAALLPCLTVAAIFPIDICCCFPRSISAAIDANQG